MGYFGICRYLELYLHSCFYFYMRLCVARMCGRFLLARLVPSQQSSIHSPSPILTLASPGLELGLEGCAVEDNAFFPFLSRWDGLNGERGRACAIAISVYVSVSDSISAA